MIPLNGYTASFISHLAALVNFVGFPLHISPHILFTFEQCFQ